MNGGSRAVSKVVDSAWRRPGHGFLLACLENSCSTSGAVVILAKGAVGWLSRMQAVTASGTPEAGYSALSEAVTEVLFLRHVQDLMEPSMKILHARCKTGLSTLM